MAVDVSVTVSGPFFDGRAHAALDVMCDVIAEEVAREGRDIVRLNADTSFRTQTPYWVTQLHIADTGLHRRDVENGVIYTHWLEGVGSRNRTTRFKGYAMFRRAVQYLNSGPAAVIANRVARPFVARM